MTHYRANWIIKFSETTSTLRDWRRFKLEQTFRD